MTQKEIIDALKLATKRHDGMHLRSKADRRWYVAVAVKKKLLREAVALLTQDELKPRLDIDRLMKSPWDVE